ncbi:MAG: hypothetical protein CMJ19_18860 [Phycisphaeraceae bacterium]|nr:hypothetical protein [Phycisphaeraceae bacterium]
MTQFLQAGGSVLIAIITLSTVCWILIGMKWLTVINESSQGRLWIHNAMQLARFGNLWQASALCQSHHCFAGRLINACLSTYEPERRFFSEQLKPVFDAESFSLQRHMNLIACIASVLPLLGLLGTVLGMSETFSALTIQSAAQTGEIAGGISSALITTQSGLVLALPILLMHHMLSARIRRCIDQADLYLRQFQTILCKD